MNKSRISWIIAACVVLVIAGAVYFNFYEKNPTAKQQNMDEVIVPVKTAKIQIKDVSNTMVAYGTVIAAPGATDVLSVPFESYIFRLMVSNGQMVSKGDPLLEIQPSQNTYLSFSEAKTSYETTEQTLLHVKELLKLKLATNDQLLNAELAFQQAQLRLENMKKQGIEGPFHLLANADGLVRQVNVQQGAIVPAGTTLVEIVSQNHFEINLGIETEDIQKLKLDQKVFLSHVYGKPSEIVGKIRKLSYAVNPSSRLVDIFVALPSASTFLLGEFVQGNIEIGSERGKVVPRSAILQEGDRYFLFTIKNDRAIKHAVQIGMKNNDEVLVFNETLSPNDLVVIIGNYELSQGMKVRIEKSE